MTQEQSQPTLPSTTPSSHTENSQKLAWSSPMIRSLGQITTQTSGGGNSTEFDSFNNHRQ